jgi:hypothetical protein
MGVFDVIVTGAAPAVLVLKDPPALRIELPARAEITYADVLRLAYEQHAAVLDELAQAQVAEGRYGPLARDSQPLLLPPMRKLVRPAKPRQREAVAARWWLADFWMF